MAKPILQQKKGKGIFQQKKGKVANMRHGLPIVQKQCWEILDFSRLECSVQQESRFAGYY